MTQYKCIIINQFIISWVLPILVLLTLWKKIWGPGPISININYEVFWNKLKPGLLMVYRSSNPSMHHTKTSLKINTTF